MKSAIAATVTCLCLLAGCKSTPAPTQQLTSAKASMRAARELGAERIPRAQLHLQLAEEQARHADELMDDGMNDRAGLLFQRADADAQLAIALSRQYAARDRLRQSMEVMELTP